MNKYLEKIAKTLSFSGSTSGASVASSFKGISTPATAPGPNPVNSTKRGFRKLDSRMGPHTTPDDLLPNPKRMDVRVQ